MPTNSTTRRNPSKAVAKSAKPRPDFPLFVHQSGRWAKKVQGSLLYFGPTKDDPRGDKAVKLWIEEKDYCLAHGRRSPKSSGKLLVPDLVNRVLNDKRRKVDNGELTLHTFKTWYNVCAMVVKQFGTRRHVDTLGPDDFDALFRAEISGKAATTRALWVGYVRSLFQYAHNDDQRLIEAPVMFGKSFKPPKLTRRAERPADELRMFTADQIHLLLRSVQRPMRAFILLAANCGFGNNDIATLTFSVLDLEKGWHTHARPKNGVRRRCPLWPETIDAIRQAIKLRPKPADPARKDLVFLTRNGLPYVRLSAASAAAMQNDDASKVNYDNPINTSFWKTLTRVGMKRPGLSFYCLRHGFETIVGGSKDQVAVDYIMGHVTPGMGSKYREGIEDERLQSVADHVHGWLFGVEKSAGMK